MYIIIIIHNQSIYRTENLLCRDYSKGSQLIAIWRYLSSFFTSLGLLHIFVWLGMSEISYYLCIKSCVQAKQWGPGKRHFLHEVFRCFARCTRVIGTGNAD